MKYLQGLAESVNMPFVNITWDMGAAINAYKYLWTNPVKFSDIVIHPGDFHFVKENFAVIGNLIKGSGFEDVIFQGEICSSGSLNGVLSASHYNRAWAVHLAFSEALERLLLNRFLEEVSLPQSLIDIFSDPDSVWLERTDIHINNFVTEYETFRSSVRAGSLGKTAQFWMLSLDLMRLQNIAHSATQENDFSMRVSTRGRVCCRSTLYSIK